MTHRPLVRGFLFLAASMLYIGPAAAQTDSVTIDFTSYPTLVFDHQCGAGDNYPEVPQTVPLGERRRLESLSHSDEC